MALVEDINAALKELEHLRIEYEKYFIGVEARAPAEMHTAVERKIRRLLTQLVTRTSEKFQMENLRNRFVSLNNYWARVLREMEEGTYFRQKARNKMRAQRANKSEMAEAAGMGADGSFDLSAGADSGTEKSQPKQYGDIFDSYQQAGAKVSYDKLAATLKKQEEAIKAKYGAKSVQFSVKVVDGKPKLSAKPIK